MNLDLNVNLDYVILVVVDGLYSFKEERPQDQERERERPQDQERERAQNPENKR